MENQLTNELISQLLTKPVRRNNYVPREEPKKVLGISVKQPPKDFIPIEQRYKNLFGEYYLERDSELKIREINTPLDIGKYGMFKHEWNLYFVERNGQKRIIIKNVVQHGEIRKEKGILAGLVEIAEDVASAFTIGLIRRDYPEKGQTSYKLYQGRVQVIIDEDTIDLQQLNKEQIWNTEDKEEEVCLYEITAELFVRLFNSADRAKVRIVGEKWIYLVPNTDEEIKRWKADQIKRLKQQEEQKKKKAEEKKKEYKGKSSDEIEEEVEKLLDMYFEQREVDGEMRYCSWTSKYSCDYVEKQNLADNTYPFNEYAKISEMDNWRVAFDFFFQTQHWPQSMQKYISNLEKKEATDAKINAYKDKVIGFFKRLFDKTPKKVKIAVGIFLLLILLRIIFG